MRDEANRTARVEMRVPFHDLDPMQVVWHGNYMKYFDLARQQIFDDSGVDLYQVATERGILFPIIKTAVKHIQPLRFRDHIAVTARLRDCHRRIVLDFEIQRLPEGPVCARARSEQVAVRTADQGLEFSIPEDVRRALLGSGP